MNDKHENIEGKRQLKQSLSWGKDGCNHFVNNVFKHFINIGANLEQAQNYSYVKTQGVNLSLKMV